MLASLLLCPCSTGIVCGHEGSFHICTILLSLHACDQLLNAHRVTVPMNSWTAVTANPFNSRAHPSWTLLVALGLRATVS